MVLLLEFPQARRPLTSPGCTLSLTLPVSFFSETEDLKISLPKSQGEISQRTEQKGQYSWIVAAVLGEGGNHTFTAHEKH